MLHPLEIKRLTGSAPIRARRLRPRKATVQPGRPPSKTGVSSFQRFKRVIDLSPTRSQCEAFTKRRGGMAGYEARCKKMAEPNAKRCKTHGGTPGTPRARSGLLVALSLEETPRLLCDR